MPSGTSSITAPHANTPIPLHLGSITGMRHRVLNCMECGQPMLERSSDTMYRLNSSSQPHLITIAGNTIHAMCGRCMQQYEVNISIDVTYSRDTGMHTTAQSVSFAIAPIKHTRYLFCLECGKKFHGMSDRISIVSDNTVPKAYINNSRMGPLEAMCTFTRCRQRWALMV